jgi:hypothetical protein
MERLLLAIMGTSSMLIGTSASRPKADIADASVDVCF